MRRFAKRLGLSLDWMELAFNAVAAAACWCAAVWLLAEGCGWLAGFGDVPRSMPDAWAFAASPGALQRLARAGGGCLALAAAAALGVSAVQGTWWSLRKFSRMPL